MKFKDLKKSLTIKIEPCYLLAPESDYEDIFLKSSCISNITRAVIQNCVDLNLSVFTTDNLVDTEVLKSLNTLPFLNDKRLVIIKEIDVKKNEKLIKALKEYLKKPNDSTVLVIDEKINSAFKTLEKEENVCVVDCSRVEIAILRKFVLTECDKQNIQIDLQAVNKLIEFTNSDMSKLSLEINKLVNLKLNDKNIEVEDIENNVSKSEEYQIFELTNALMRKDADKALFIVEDIIIGKKNVSSILGLIYNHFRRMFYVKISKNLSETASLLNVKEFALMKIREQNTGFSAKKLKDILELCKNTDYSIKSGKLDLINGIYNLIFSILI